NRFLAAGLTALAALAAALAGVVLGPALARLLAAGRAQPSPVARPGPEVVLLAPLAAVAMAAGIFLPLARSRAPLVGAVLARHAWQAAWVAAVIPAANALAARVRLGLRWSRAIALAGSIYGAAAIAGLAANWNDNLRFAPWVDVLAGAAIAVAGGGIVLWLRRRGLPARAAAALPAAIAVGAILMTLAAAESEPARKAATARAGLAGPVLALARGVLDADGDGFAR